MKSHPSSPSTNFSSATEKMAGPTGMVMIVIAHLPKGVEPMQNESAPIEICNHTSVGMIVFNAQHHLLLIERRKYPSGYACPAGHVDNGETYEQAALRELHEEVGLEAVHLHCVLDITVDNACRRP